MKVLERGKSFFPIKVRCEQVVDQYGFSYGEKIDFCGSLLEVEQKDISAKKWYKYPEYHGIDYGIVCPVCGRFIPIQELPEYVKTEAYKNKRA